MIKWLLLSILGNSCSPCVYALMFAGKSARNVISARKLTTYDMMYDFVDNTEEALEYWERIDDGVMCVLSAYFL